MINEGSWIVHVHVDKPVEVWTFIGMTISQNLIQHFQRENCVSVNVAEGLLEFTADWIWEITEGNTMRKSVSRR